MYVKMLDGRFAGEIKDLRSDVALEWIRQGKAARAFDETPTPVAVEASQKEEQPVFSTNCARSGKRSGKKGSR